jgi:hypothetical protein
MFTQSGLASITYPQQIVSLSIKANYTLNSESSIARVILIDSNNNEYLAFEANPLMIEELDFNCDGQVLQNDIDELAQMWRSGTPIDINLVTEKGAHCKQLGVYLGELWKKGITEIPIDDITRIGRDINSLTVDNLCEETCNLNGIIPKSLRVELIDASIYLDSVKIQKKGATTNNLLLSQTQYNQEQEEIKIQDLNENL